MTNDDPTERRETTTVQVAVLPYDSSTGVVSWHERSERITVGVSGHDVTISANGEGLIGLARELLTLAQPAVPGGSEVYLMSEGHAPTLTTGSTALRLIRGD